MKLYDFELSGNAWKIRLLLCHLQIDFEREMVDIMAGAHKGDNFANLNPLQRVPVLELDNGDSLFESNAILLYLAEGTDLLSSNPTERSHMISWLIFEQADLMRFLAHPYVWTVTNVATENEHLMTLYHKIAGHGIKKVEQVLSGQDWICGDKISVVDFALYPNIRLSEEGGFNLAKYSNILGWLERFESLPHYEPLAV